MGDPVYTGRTAVDRTESTAKPKTQPVWGESSPRNQHFPMARMTGFHIIAAEDSDIDQAISDLEDAWDTWSQATSRERYVVLSATYEHYITSAGDHGFVAYITYSR